MERVRRAQKEGGAKVAPPSTLSFIHSGCTLLDLVTGGARGAWPLGRITNIVGDKSTGKTLLAIEACANFSRQFKNGRIWYREAEAAFDPTYAETIGMPLDRVSFGKHKLDTVEDFYTDLLKQTEWCQENDRPGLYILDSLDALSARKELERDVDKGSYGADKAKQMSQLFRKLIRQVEASKMSVIIISQIRDKIGVTFGRKTSRSGGHALDFYASIIIYLSHITTLTKIRNGQKRSTGIRIKA